MSKTKSLLYEFDHGRPVEEVNTDPNSLSAWHYLSPKVGSRIDASDLECSSEMTASPGNCLSNSQSSWDSSDIIQHRSYSESIDASPLSIGSIQNSMNFDACHGEAHLVMITPPQCLFRYRYDTEMSGTHGSLAGPKGKGVKTVPTVELVNFPYEALIRVSLVTCNESGKRYPHPHSLFVKEKMYQKNVYTRKGERLLTKTGHYSDPHFIHLGLNKKDYTAKFEGMCIISSKKENFADSIRRKLYLREEEIKNCEGDSIMTRSNEEITKIVEDIAKLVDVDSVRFCFEAFQEDEDKKLVSICPPLYSDPVGNAKSAKTGKLKIAKINKCSGSCKGGDQIWLLVEKINKKGLVIKFYEEHDGRSWETCVKGDDLYLHHQYAIVFKTPPYKDTSITTDVKVLMRLERTSKPSHIDFSEPMTFVYEPARNESSQNDNLHRKESILTPLKAIQHKRPRTESSSAPSPYSFPNKRRPDYLECLLNPSFDEGFYNLDTFHFDSMPDIDFNLDEYLRQTCENDMQMQKDGISLSVQEKRRRLSICKYLLFKKRLDEGDVKKLTEQINSFQFSKRDNVENKNGLEKELVEDAASTLLSLRARAVDNNNTDSDNKNVDESLQISLHEAVLLNRPKAVNVKLKEGASCCQQDKNGNTPLHLSLMHKFDSCTEQILNSRQTEGLDLKNNEGRTALHLAGENGNLRFVERLIEAGANVQETETKTNRTVLHVAALKEHKSIVEYLLRHTDVDVSQPDVNGQTAWDLIQRFTPSIQQEVQPKLIKTEIAPSCSSDNFVNFKDAQMEEIYQILNRSGRWRKLAEMWDCGFLIPHAEERKNPSKIIFTWAEEKHGQQDLDMIRTLLDAIDEKKAILVLDDILAKKFQFS